MNSPSSLIKDSIESINTAIERGQWIGKGLSHMHDVVDSTCAKLIKDICIDDIDFDHKLDILQKTLVVLIANSIRLNDDIPLEMIVALENSDTRVALFKKDLIDKGYRTNTLTGRSLYHMNARI